MSSVKFVDGEGVENRPHLMLIGEAPGELEDKQSRPFVGRSGELIRGLIGEIFPRETIYITNVVKVRPEDNRTPTDDEIRSWLSLLFNEIINVNPALIITVGLTPAKAVSGKYSLTMKDIRGTLSRNDFYGTKHHVLHTYHPAYALRNPKAIALIQEDLFKARRFIDENT